MKLSEETLELQQYLIEMLKLAGFNLSKWISNEREVIKRSESERSPSVKVVQEEIIKPVERALGVIWDTNSEWSSSTKLWKENR